jgi:hypothetical protein
MDPAVDSGVRGVIAVYLAILASITLAVSFTAWLLWAPAVAVVQGINYITQVIVSLLRGIFISLPTLVITLLRFLWTHLITLLGNLWTYPLHETILRVLEVLVWIFVGGGLIIATKPELIENTRWIFAFLRDSGPRFAQRVVTVISDGVPLVYRAAIQLPAQTIQTILDFPNILPDIATLEMVEENNALPTIHVTDLTEENNAPLTDQDLTTTPPIIVDSPNPQPRFVGSIYTHNQRDLTVMCIEIRQWTRRLCGGGIYLTPQ